MSADRDRGIRRIKQKRAKAQKKQERTQRSASAPQEAVDKPRSGHPA